MIKQHLEYIQEKLDTGNKDLVLHALVDVVMMLNEKIEMLEKESSGGEREKLVKQYKNSIPKMEGGL